MFPSRYDHRKSLKYRFHRIRRATEQPKGFFANKAHGLLVSLDSSHCWPYICDLSTRLSTGSLKPRPKAGGISNLGVGLALRCLQRLSLPNIATQQCHWHDNWCTRGSSTRVLSYYGQLPSIILRPRQIRTELSHDVLNPAHVPL